MKKLSLVAIAAAEYICCAQAQEVKTLAPSSETPKTVEPLPPPASAQPKSPRPNPDGDKPINPDQPNLAIQGIVIVKTRAEIQEAGVSNAAPIVVRDIPFLDGADFRAVIHPFIGRLLTENTIRDLEDAVILYCRNRGKVLVDVILPEQNIENGVLQLWFLEGRVGRVTVRNDGVKWFRDKFILDSVHLRPGDEVDSRKLTDDLNWLNNNPFRQVDTVFKPGEKLGLTDVELQVDDRFPLRTYFGAEDSGTRYTGENRLLAGFNWGNAFGLDQQLNYQYLTDFHFFLVRAHSGSYIIPLPWHHTLMLYGAYVDGKAEFGNSAPSANGISWQTSLRYSVPLPDLGKYRHELSAGFDFKRSNNNLEAGGDIVLQSSHTEVDQFYLGYSGVAPDRYGRTSVQVEGYGSPGGLTEDNTDSSFQGLRAGSKASYYYARANIERITRLPFDFSWVLRGWAQAASGRLQPSEELALGGYNTIRGYDERVVLGDEGWIINNEIRTPPIVMDDWFELPNAKDQLQFLAFFDYGAVRVIDAGPQDGSNPDITLYSVGAGLRWSVARNFSLRFDYGFPLTQQSINQYASRAHIGALLSF
jgi:hemolysin activation/secretion protein